jgi:uncharacterized phage-associated protein
MASARSVADHLLRLASAEDEPECLTHMRLQKLLYYVQGWSLALRGKPMFDDRIEAWAHGPVVRSLFSTFTDFGSLPVDLEAHPLLDGDLDVEEKEFIEAVWDAYKQHSTFNLRQMTHGEDPWIEAHKGYGPADLCTVEITKESMKAFFEKRAAET